MTNVTDGLTAGYRYLQFGQNTPKTVTVRANGPAEAGVRLDAYDGKEIARISIPAGNAETTAPLNSGVIGKHAVYFRFSVRNGEGPAAFDSFTFD